MHRASPKYWSPKYLGYAWLAFAAGTTVYRGLTQSLTIDESFVYHLFEKYDAAYHVLRRSVAGDGRRFALGTVLLPIHTPPGRAAAA